MTPVSLPAPSSTRRSPLENSSNKSVRSTHIQKRRRAEKRLKSEQRRQRQRIRKDLGSAAPPKNVPITIESARVYDEQTGPALTPEQIGAVSDEFSPVLEGLVNPRVVITTGLKPSSPSLDFIVDFLPICPGSTYFERHDTSLSDFAGKASEKGYTDVLIIKDDKGKLSTLTHIHLPDGPSAIYKISSFVPTKDIVGGGRATKQTPELLVKNFSTSLGVRVGRMLSCLFPHRPNFTGRQAITFHNQRDFIFFRFHRYIFQASRDKARLQELGPRFTLKLRALQKGIFQNPALAEHEYRWTTKTDRNRRRFFL